MDILAQIFEYDLLGIFFSSRVIPELDEYPTVFAVGHEGEYLEVMGIDLGEEIAKMVEQSWFACISNVYPWAAVVMRWVLYLVCEEVANSLPLSETNREDRINPQPAFLRLLP